MHRTDLDIFFGSESALVLVWPSLVSFLVFNNFVDTCEPTNQPKSQTVTHPTHLPVFPIQSIPTPRPTAISLRFALFLFLFFFLWFQTLFCHTCIFQLSLNLILMYVTRRLLDLCFLFNVTYKVHLHFAGGGVIICSFLLLCYFTMWNITGDPFSCWTVYALISAAADRAALTSCASPSTCERGFALGTYTLHHPHPHSHLRTQPARAFYR